MTTTQIRPVNSQLSIKWEKLPDDFPLPDDSVDSELQPLLAAALREALELAGLILEANLIATNFGICATVANKTVVKAPDWVYIPKVQPLRDGSIRRSYAPHAEGDKPLIVMEFISETEGTEYSINPHFPYGKWYFYEKILQVPLYAIFHPKTEELEVYRLLDDKYQLQSPDSNGRVWLEEMGLFLSMWQGKKAEMTTTWLRWWDSAGNLLLWGQEQLDLERQKIELERQKVQEERQRAEEERQRADQAESALIQERLVQDKLMAKLRELGIDPEQI